jgi:F-type H+-transporting ATPase subunit gamma
MSNLKTLKNRINSVKSTQKMTKAMKMVAASRMRKAKSLVESSRPYSDKIQEMISQLASNVAVRDKLNDDFPLLSGRKDPKKHLIIVISSDRGLCGGLNSSAVKFAKNKITELQDQNKQCFIYCIGQKAYDQLKVTHSEIIIDKSVGLFKNDINYKIAQEISDKIIEMFNSDKFDICEVIYSKFKSAIAQEQMCKQLIPVKINSDKSSDNQNNESPINYESGEEETLNELLPRNLMIQLYNELLENNASEQGARMAAMEAATNNAGQMIKNLTLIYNRTRQANITRELIDIISGANSV